MKRITIIVFSIFYLMVSFGYAFNFHYCGGHFKSVNLLEENNSCCCGKMDKNNSCCKNIIVKYKLDDNIKINQDYKISIFVFHSSNLACINAFEYFSDNSELFGFEYNSFSPPKKQPAWLVNCSLTYYG